MLKSLKMQTAEVQYIKLHRCKFWMHNRYSSIITTRKGPKWEGHQASRYHLSKVLYCKTKNGHQGHWLDRWHEHQWWVTPLQYGDNTALITKTTDQLQAMLTKLDTQSLAIGLNMEIKFMWLEDIEKAKQRWYVMELRRWRSINLEHKVNRCQNMEFEISKRTRARWKMFLPQ